MKAKVKPAAAFFTCPACEETILGKPDRPGGDCRGYWLVEDLPVPRWVTCRCGEKVELYAPWHRRGVFPVLEAAGALALELFTRGLAANPADIVRPEGYEQGAGDCWAVWWHDAETRHEIHLIDVTAGPAIIGTLPPGLDAWCKAKGWYPRSEHA